MEPGYPGGVKPAAGPASDSGMVWGRLGTGAEANRDDGGWVDYDYPHRGVGRCLQRDDRSDPRVRARGGRDPAEIGIEGTVDARLGSPEDWVDAVAQWRDYGATHVTFNTMNSGFESPEQHIDAISRFKEVTS